MFHVFKAHVMLMSCSQAGHYATEFMISCRIVELDGY